MSEDAEHDESESDELADRLNRFFERQKERDESDREVIVLDEALPGHNVIKTE